MRLQGATQQCASLAHHVFVFVRLGVYVPVYLPMYVYMHLNGVRC
jgi:hypothetical protein